MIGDWNVDISTENQKSIYLKQIARQFKLTLLSAGSPTRKNSILDFALCGEALADSSIATFPSPSDHHCVMVEFSVGITPSAI
jgi:hypothetical protein